MQAPPITQQPTPKYTAANGRPVDLVVFHTMECPEDSSRAEWCATYLRDSNRTASAHFYLDDDSIVQGVDVKHVAWAAPGGNRQGIQLEHAGYAAQNPTQWDDDYSRRMLDLSARLTAWLCTTHRIPVVWVTAADLRGLGPDRRAATQGATYVAANVLDYVPADRLNRPGRAPRPARFTPHGHGAPATADAAAMRLRVLRAYGATGDLRGRLRSTRS